MTDGPTPEIEAPENTRVRIYQDVDGVLNAKMPYWGDKPRNGHAKDNGYEYRIRWSATMAAELDGLDADRVWLTTWCDNANTEIAPLLGLSGPSRVLLPRSGRVTFPSIFWKVDALSEEQINDPSPFIWLEDELMDEDRELVEKLGGCAPKINSQTGISKANMEEMRAYIAKHSS